MPPIKKPLQVHVSLGVSRLHLDEIEEIVQVMMEVAPVTIQAEMADHEYSLESLAEIAELPSGRIKSLRVATEITLSRMVDKEPHIVVKLGRWRSYISISDPTLEARGALDQIVRIVSRRSKLRRIIVNPITTICSICAGVAGLVVSQVLPYPWIAVAVIVEYLGIVALATSVLTGFLPGGIIPQHRNEVPSFWQRNRDDLVKGAVLTIIGALAGAAITLLVKGR